MNCAFFEGVSSRRDGIVVESLSDRQIRLLWSALWGEGEKNKARVVKIVSILRGPLATDDSNLMLGESVIRMAKAHNLMTSSSTRLLDGDGARYSSYHLTDKGREALEQLDG